MRFQKSWYAPIQDAGIILNALLVVLRWSLTFFKKKSILAVTLLARELGVTARGFRIWLTPTINYTGLRPGYDLYWRKVEAPPMTDNEVLETYRSVENLVFYLRGKTDYKGETDIWIGPLWYWNTKDLLAQFFLQAHYCFGPIKNWRNWRELCIGIASDVTSLPRQNVREVTERRLHMPMLDYDGKDIRMVIRKDVKSMQEKYDLGPAWIYTTKKGYHVYFFTDAVPWTEYEEIIKQSNCCTGFKKISVARKSGVLRVSAKYTAFDIEFLRVIRPSRPTEKRMHKKAHIVQALIQEGQACGTHLASLYPQWAYFREDRKEWKRGVPVQEEKANKTKSSSEALRLEQGYYTREERLEKARYATVGKKRRYRRKAKRSAVAQQNRAQDMNQAPIADHNHLPSYAPSYESPYNKEHYYIADSSKSKSQPSHFVRAPYQNDVKPYPKWVHTYSDEHTNINYFIPEKEEGSEE